jgi:hypothetical protein
MIYAPVASIEREIILWEIVMGYLSKFISFLKGLVEITKIYVAKFYSIESFTSLPLPLTPQTTFSISIKIALQNFCKIILDKQQVTTASTCYSSLNYIFTAF